MKRYDPRRAAGRPIEEKAFALLHAMSEEAALRLHSHLGQEVLRTNPRAKLFYGVKE